MRRTCANGQRCGKLFLSHFCEHRRILMTWASSGCLWKVLVTKNASTLQRHLCRFKVFIEFVFGHSADFTCNPGDLELIAVGESERSVTSVLKFAGGMMGWAELLSDLECQIVAAWRSPPGPVTARREAMPLPLFD